ncbi:unnamed protein product [Paramecium octaurelia]|uniref:Uncharacterized protein n=1 Tax=Paramecium octaurelia TaxID=43137 RepID=A0A8S1XXI6_PAROT|nr:unnamed protein product [Paramecium octaurelia]
MLQKQFEEEEERSKEFLAKLNQIKKVSKDMKNKNVQSVQRQEWSKEYLQLMKVERMLNIDLESKLLLLEIQSDLPKFCLAALLEQGVQNYKQVKDELIYQLQNLKKIQLQLRKEQLPRLDKKTNSESSQFKELALSFKDYLQQMISKLEVEYQKESTIVDEENEETLDMQQCNVAICNSFRSRIEQEYLNDKLILYAQNCDDEELEILENYAKALEYLYERYQLEIQKLTPKERIEVSEEMLYLGSSNSLHSMQRLMLHFPKKSRPELQEVVDYIRKQKDINKRLTILQRNWKIEYSQLQNKSEQLLNDMQQNKIQKNQRWMEYLQLKQQRIRIAEELEEKRVEYEKKQLILQQQKEEEREQQEQLDQAKHDEWLKHKAEIAEIALTYQAEKEQKRQQFLIQQQQQAEVVKKQQLQQIEQAKPRVQQRQEKEVVKREDKKLKQEIKKQEPEMKAQRIEDAINRYSIRPNVDKDFQRLISETETRQLRKQTKYDKADKIPLSNVTGFNINQLMSDMRYRLQVALNDAGLGQTAYAREVILGMSKPQ